jgi:hypothetical protein
MREINIEHFIVVAIQSIPAPLYVISDVYGRFYQLIMLILFPAIILIRPFDVGSPFSLVCKPHRVPACHIPITSSTARCT